MAVVSSPSRHFQRNGVMIADVSQEIEGVARQQLLPLKIRSIRVREADFLECIDQDNITLCHGAEES